MFLPCYFFFFLCAGTDLIWKVILINCWSRLSYWQWRQISIKLHMRRVATMISAIKSIDKILKKFPEIAEMFSVQCEKFCDLTAITFQVNCGQSGRYRLTNLPFLGIFEKYFFNFKPVEIFPSDTTSLHLRHWILSLAINGNFIGN